MDARLAEMLTFLREGQSELDAEVQPRLRADAPDSSMLERFRDVADEHAGHARLLRRLMTKTGAAAAEPDALKEVNRLCTYFVRTAALIAQEIGDGQADPSLA